MTRGLEIRKAVLGEAYVNVLGEAYVNNALKNADGFNKPFQELVTEYCWGAVWGRDELPRKTIRHCERSEAIHLAA
jgi:4-carboxymuconolactone decarboxylase